MSGWKKQTILFGAAIFAFALFLAFTISGFVVSSKTSGFSLPEKNMKVISVQSEDDVSYISTDDLLLVCANGSEIQWEAALADRTSDVVVTSEYVVAGYVSERKVDVFDKENGEKLNTLEIPYPVLSLDADDANVYVAAKKGGLKGSEIYHFTDYAQEKEGVSLSLSNVIGDVKIHPQSKVLYGVSTDYNIFTFENASGALVSERFASVPYEPLALGFSGGELIVADTTGYINVFSGNSLERSVNTGMTLCAFAANDTSETVVAANVSGKAAIVNVNTGKVTKISAPTEVQSISVSDSGVIALSEYRGFRTQFYDIDRIGTLLFFGWAKYVGLALTVLSIPVAVAGWFAVGDKRRVTLQKGLRRLKVGFRKSWKSYTFILPTFVLLGLFMYVPAVWGLILSFFDYVPGVYTRPVGFANFVAVLKDPFFTGGIGNMLIFLVTDLIKALVPAVLIAELILALNSKKAQYWVRVLIYIPGILPGVAVLLIWTKGIYGDMGLLNSIVELFGGRGTDWLGNDKCAHVPRHDRAAVGRAVYSVLRRAHVCAGIVQRIGKTGRLFVAEKYSVHRLSHDPPATQIRVHHHLYHLHSGFRKGVHDHGTDERDQYSRFANVYDAQFRFGLRQGGGDGNAALYHRIRRDARQSESAEDGKQFLREVFYAET